MIVYNAVPAWVSLVDTQKAQTQRREKKQKHDDGKEPIVWRWTV